MVDMPKSEPKKLFSPVVEAVPVARQPIAQEPQHTAAVPRRKITMDQWSGVERSVDEQRDALFVPPEIIPDGFTVEWKRYSTHNQIDSAHQADLRRVGWQPVPADAEGFADYFASYIQRGSDVIEYKGTILMIRPKRMSDAALEETKKNANAQVMQKMDEMGMTSAHKDIPAKRFQLSRGYEKPEGGGMKVPD